MLIKREVLEKVGLLDESYFMYVEDLDYSYKTVKSGYKLAVAHKSVIWHKVGASGEGEISEFSAYWAMRNKIKFVLSYKSKVKKFFALSLQFIFHILRILKWYLKGYRNILIAQTKGLKDGVLS